MLAPDEVFLLFVRAFGSKAFSLRKGYLLFFLFVWLGRFLLCAAMRCESASDNNLAVAGLHLYAQSGRQC